MVSSPSSKKGFRQGTHRVIAPEQTLARIVPLMSAMGITRVATITGLDVIGIPVVAVTRPNSRSFKEGASTASAWSR